MQAWRYGAFSIRRAPVLIVFTVLAISLLGLGATPTGSDKGIEQAPSPADQKAPAKAYLIVARGDVGSRLAKRVRREREKATAAAAEVVIVEIDTFGGRRWARTTT